MINVYRYYDFKAFYDLIANSHATDDIPTDDVMISLKIWNMVWFIVTAYPRVWLVAKSASEILVELFLFFFSESRERGL